MVSGENIYNNSCSDKKKMEADGIVPGILPVVPSKKITLIYNNGKEVNSGNELTPAEVKEEPKEVKWDANPQKYYTLVMFDPDAPCRCFPLAGSVNHWLVVNIIGSDVKTGQIVVEYRGSGPPRWTGFHRYIFVVFEQGEKIEFTENYVGKDATFGRIWFSIRKFSNKYKFAGKLHAANYFKAHWNSGR